MGFPNDVLCVHPFPPQVTAFLEQAVELPTVSDDAINAAYDAAYWGLTHPQDRAESKLCLWEGGA